MASHPLHKPNLAEQALFEQGVTCLVVDAPAAVILARRQPTPPHLVFTALALLDQATLAAVRPDRVVIPLISAQHDATQSLTQLARLGYAGTVCILTPPLPHPGPVLAELRALAPAMDLHLVALPDD